MDTKPDMKTLLAKVEELKGKNDSDLSSAEDLSVAVMNLVSLEEHFAFTGMKTHEASYFDTAGEVRELRKELLAELLPMHEGETWCAGKHLLAATMRMIEVGAKYRSEGKKEEAKRMFERAYTAYSLFWALKLRLVGVKARAPAGPPTLTDILGQLADCCDE